MAATPSTMLELGTLAPNFELMEAEGGKISLSQGKGKHGTLVVFMCNHCPYVLHILDALVTVANEAVAQGIGVVAINSNDVEKYPEDSPEKMKEMKKELGFRFPYAFDETQKVAKAYQAACTPDFFLFDKDLKLVYRGQFDDSRPRTAIPVTGRDLKAAMECVVQGKTVSLQQKPSLGCNIKWKG